jgi:hypothetical protein
VWRSTGLTDRDAAVAKALEWEKEARIRRAALGLGPRRPNLRDQSFSFALDALVTVLGNQAQPLVPSPLRGCGPRLSSG